jgi:uncharacterized protein (TIGR02145 family)
MKMKRIWLLASLMVLGSVISCDQEEDFNPLLPSVQIDPITVITYNSAKGGGNVTDEGSSAVKSRGLIWAKTGEVTLENPDAEFSINGEGPGSFNVEISGLKANSSYQIKAYAINNEGTGYSPPMSIETPGGLDPSDGKPCEGQANVIDIDGNIYNTVRIGEQCWMKENLKVTRYRNGDPIPGGLPDDQWMSTNSGAYSIYYNPFVELTSEQMVAAYGLLYNWFAVADNRGICPQGWRMPSNDEWTELTDYIIGMVNKGGRNLKSCRQINAPVGGECSTEIHPRWVNYEVAEDDGTDIYGFSALPAGSRFGSEPSYISLGVHVGFWSSTEDITSTDAAWSRYLSYDPHVTHGTSDKNVGISVRCIRD